MKPLLLTTLIALAAPAADAGGLHFDFRHKGKRVHIGIHDRHGRRAHRDNHRRPIVRRHYDCHRVWVPGHHDTVRRRVWVPGRVERVYQPAVYQTRYDRCGYETRVLVRRGYWTSRGTPGRYEVRVERVRNGGYFKRVCNTPGHHHAGHRDAGLHHITHRRR